MGVYIQKLSALVLIYLGSFSFWQEEKGLVIGDQLPDVEIAEVLNREANTLKLGKQDSKLYIIDFWATTCGTCLASFPRLDSLQRHFQDTILILAVTKQERAKVAPFLEKHRKWMDVTFPIIAGDTLLHEFFPHRGVPHVVWLSADREVLGITDGKAVTAENIALVLSGEDINLPTKKGY